MADRDPIDSRLGDVPLPAGLQERLSLEALFDDDAIDRMLRGVPVPPGLAERMLAARSLAADRSRSVDLDRPASGVAVDRQPPRPAAMPGDRAVNRGRWAGGWWVGAGAALVAGLLVAINVGGPARRVDRRSPIDVTAVPVEADPVTVRGGRIEWQVPAGGETLVRAPASTDPDPDTLPVAAAGGDEPALASTNDLEVDEPETPGVVPSGPEVVGFPAVAEQRRGGDPMEVVPLASGGSRREVPRSRAYDLAFELRYGEPPFVEPRAGLGIDRPPLTSRTATFDAVRWSPGPRIRRSDAGRLRVEDVLAAAPERFQGRADSDSGPRLSLYGVRSLRPVSASIVEVEVTAPRLPRSGPPIDAALVLDRATSPAAWNATCRGLRMLAAEMRPADRITIVLVGGRARVAGRRLDPVAVAKAADDLVGERLETDSGGLVAGGQFARQLLAETGGSGPVVLVTGAALDAGPAGDAANGQTQVVRVAPHAVAAVGDDADLVLPTGGGVGRRIIEGVFGRSAVAATGCRLSVSFDPLAVRAYRLIGHRQTAVESLAGGQAEPIDMVAGQTVRVAYEVAWRPTPSPTPSGPVVSAKFEWYPAGESGHRSISAGLRRGEVEEADGGGMAPPGQRTWLPSPRGCELLLAVGLGELASESAHLGARLGGPAVADVVQAWRRRGDVTPWGDSLIESLERLGVVKPSRPATDAGR